MNSIYDRNYNDIFEAETFLVFFFFIRRTGNVKLIIENIFALIVYLGMR